MKPPEQITPIDYGTALIEFFALHASRRCRECGTRLAVSFCYVSLHAADFPNCAGSGSVIHLPIPFCEHCEPEMGFISQGCLHVPYAESRAEHRDVSCVRAMLAAFADVRR